MFACPLRWIIENDRPSNSKGHPLGIAMSVGCTDVGWLFRFLSVPGCIHPFNVVMYCVFLMYSMYIHYPRVDLPNFHFLNGSIYWKWTEMVLTKFYLLKSGLTYESDTQADTVV